MMNRNLNTAKKLLLSGRPEDALEMLKEFLSKVDETEEWRVHELIGAAFHDLGNAEGAVQAYLNAAQTDMILRSQRQHFSNYIFALHYLPRVTAKHLSDAAEIYNSLYRDVEPLRKNNHRSNGKIHVAFIAPHFLNSSSACFYESLLTDYDRDRFKVTAWSLSSDEDKFTKKIRHNVGGYFDISETSFEEAAQDIQDSGADILFDLGGHTDGGITLNIMAYCPARLQISGIGYFDTTGLDSIDYFLTDNFLADNSPNFFAEKLLMLESTFAFKADISVSRNKHRDFYFGCLNNFMKITDEYLLCIKKILAETPSAKIIFRDTTPMKSRQRFLKKRIEKIGIDDDRVEIFCGDDNFFNDYNKVNLILDTFPYTGGAMTALAISNGVPVLNLRGELHHSRIGADILRLANLNSLIVENVDDYKKKAVAFYHNDLNVEIVPDNLINTSNFVKNFYDVVAKLIC